MSDVMHNKQEAAYHANVGPPLYVRTSDTQSVATAVAPGSKQSAYGLVIEKVCVAGQAIDCAARSQYFSDISLEYHI